MLAEGCGELLRVDGLVTGYGKKRVVDGVTLDVASGEIVALIGHNGAGKSTLLKGIFGLLPIWEGSVYIDGARVSPVRPRTLLGLGIAYVPQGNRVFGDLSVVQNLEMGGTTVGDRRKVRGRIAEVLTLFPELSPRLRQRAATLSGGEKQILALATGLITSPRLLLLDEPSLGLAPARLSQALTYVANISRHSQVAVVIVEQKVREVLKIAQRVYVVRNGQLSYSGVASSLQDDAALREVYL